MNLKTVTVLAFHSSEHRKAIPASVEDTVNGPVTTA